MPSLFSDRVLAPPAAAVAVAAGSDGSGSGMPGRDWGGCGAGGDDAVDTPDDLEVLLMMR